MKHAHLNTIGSRNMNKINLQMNIYITGIYKYIKCRPVYHLNVSIYHCALLRIQLKLKHSSVTHYSKGLI